MGPAATRKNPNLHKRAFFTPGVGKALHTVGKDETTLKYAPPPKKKKDFHLLLIHMQDN